MDRDKDLQDKIDRLARALRERITAPDGSQGQHRPLQDEAWYDEVRIVTVPRFKTSGMSGDEWRTSAVAQFLRKGEVVASERFSDVKAAAAWLPWGSVSALETADFPDVEYFCAQPPCRELSDTFYRVKTLYNRDGSKAEHQYPCWRGFCARHSERADSNMEDRAGNYEWFAGDTPSRGAKDGPDASPSSFGGVIDLT